MPSSRIGIRRLRPAALHPVAEQRADGADLAADVLVLAQGQQLQVVGQAQVEPQLLQVGVGTQQQVALVAGLAS